MQNDKIVNEIDALKRHQKPQVALPPLDMEPSTSKAAALKRRMLSMPSLPLGTSEIIRKPVASASTLLRRQQPEPEENANLSIGNDESRTEAKRRRIDREKKLTHISSNDKKVFRCDVAQIVEEHLQPYRTNTCKIGRITNHNDFLHLTHRLTYYIMTKEVKYCESVGQRLLVNDSVKRKSRDFIKVYMRKFGEVFQRQENAPDFKEVKLPPTI